jgi:hypothetical protein
MLNEWEASEMIKHFSLLHSLNANDEWMGKKVDADHDLGLFLFFHVSMRGVNINIFFCK